MTGVNQSKFTSWSEAKNKVVFQIIKSPKKRICWQKKIKCFSFLVFDNSVAQYLVISVISTKSSFAHKTLLFLVANIMSAASLILEGL